MTIENQLKNLILDRYNSIREFTIKIDMAYSTLNSIFTRGIQNATISNILKICDELHISADALANGRIEYSSRLPDEETRDINEILANTKRQLLTNHALMFNGKPADEESIQSIIDAMEIGMEIAKRKSEKK